ncbi:MAG TPA: hypothetical protein VGB44_09455 [Flavobacterium sp.]|jgi:hypothetical protein
MNSLDKILKKVPIPRPLKYYFGEGSYEFNQISIEEKLEMLHLVVHAGFSVFDLSERFRKDRADRYSHENMHSVLRGYISTLISNNYIDPLVNRYYQDDSDEIVAKDLDAFLIEPITPEELLERAKKKFNID